MSFLPDTLYQILLNPKKLIPITARASVFNEAADENNYNILSFRDNLELLLHSPDQVSSIFEETKRLGIVMRLIKEITPSLKLIEISFRYKKGATQVHKSKRYLLAYSLFDQRGYITLIQCDDGSMSISERMVLSLA